MELLAHRGVWLNKSDRNTLEALFRGLDEGYGLETDVRDLDGQLVISHDMPSNNSAIPLERLLSYYAHGHYTSTLGLNIKADGLQTILKQQLLDYDIKKYFVFDMSVPDTLSYLKQGMRTFVRRSELEYHPELEHMSQGVWMDELIEPWIGVDDIHEQAAHSKALCLVSGELHGREYTPQWARIKGAIDSGCPSEKLLMCTDVPKEAERFFNERN